MLTGEDGDKPKKTRRTRKKGVSDVERQPLTPAEKARAIDDAMEFFYRIGSSLAAGFLNRIREAGVERAAAETEDFKKQ